MLSSWWMIISRTAGRTLVVVAVIADRGSSFIMGGHGLGALIGIGSHGLRPS